MTIKQTLSALSPTHTFYFIGIKGSGTSALAQILNDLGCHVEGSDIESFVFTEVKLREKNIPIHRFEESLPNITPTIIYSAAFNEEHPQRKEAVLKGLSIYSYYEFLSHLVANVPSVAVSGCHGKTTTTSFLSQLTKSLDPTYLIGDGTGKGGEGPFVFEACEYRNHFHHYRPTWSIINNVDFDHPDFFRDLNHVMESFLYFGDLSSKDDSLQLMRNSNPGVVPRNHRVEEALEAAVNQGDYSVMERLLHVLTNPYSHSPEHVEYCTLPMQSERPYRTFCGT